MNASESKRGKVWVRFPNESSFEEISLNLSEFKPEREFGDETFGWYKGTYLSVRK